MTSPLFIWQSRVLGPLFVPSKKSRPTLTLIRVIWESSGWPNPEHYFLRLTYNTNLDILTKDILIRIWPFNSLYNTLSHCPGGRKPDEIFALRGSPDDFSGCPTARIDYEAVGENCGAFFSCRGSFKAAARKCWIVVNNAFYAYWRTIREIIQFTHTDVKNRILHIFMDASMHWLGLPR